VVKPTTSQSALICESVRALSSSRKLAAFPAVVGRDGTCETRVTALEDREKRKTSASAFVSDPATRSAAALSKATKFPSALSFGSLAKPLAVFVALAGIWETNALVPVARA
jgi:hypothetical protein